MSHRRGFWGSKRSVRIRRVSKTLQHTATHCNTMSHRRGFSWLMRSVRIGCVCIPPFLKIRQAHLRVYVTKKGVGGKKGGKKGKKKEKKSHSYVSAYPSPFVDIWLALMRVLKKSWHTYERGVSDIWMSHGTHMIKAGRTYEWVMAHIRMEHVAYVNESCCTNAWIMGHICDFICVPWLMHMRDTTHVYVRHNSCTLSAPILRQKARGREGGELGRGGGGMFSKFRNAHYTI